jgi:two-component system cell cycle response regulator
MSVERWKASADDRHSVTDGAALDPALELERNRVVVELAGAVAHNLKQPLAVAWGYLELLLDDSRMLADLPPDTAHYLREIQGSLRSMNEIINQLQQVTRYQTRPYAGSLEILDIT